MKKLLLATMAIMAVNALASDNNVYIKLGGDAYTNYNKVTYESPVSFNGEKPKIDFLTSEKGRGIGGFLEVTRNLTPDFEAGLGVGYIGRYDGENHILEFKRDNGEIEKAELNNPRYSSIPVYATAKFNIDAGTEFTPYVKADLGYAFNRSNGDFKMANKAENNNGESGKLNTKVSNGIYAGLGIGAEYNNFLAEVSYHYTNSDISFSPSKELAGELTEREKNEAKIPSKSYSNKAVRVSLGYKFNF